jgi:TRAP-type C4-dicarboxylate transport system permease small subunit
MRYLLLCITTLVSCFGAYFSASMGMDYINPDIGHGLHPLIAFTVSWILISIPACLWFLALFIERDDPEVTELTNEQATKLLAEQGIYLPRK